MFRFFFGEKDNLKFYIDYFRPSWKVRIYESWFKANGLSLKEALWLQTRKELERDNFDKCYICGRTLKRAWGWVNLIPTYDDSLKSIEYICSDHGGEWWNCLTGEKVIFCHKPYWQRWLRNHLDSLVLTFVIPIRFIYFFFQSIYFWYIAIWFYWGRKNLENRRRKQ